MRYDPIYIYIGLTGLTGLIVVVVGLSSGILLAAVSHPVSHPGPKKVLNEVLGQLSPVHTSQVRLHWAPPYFLSKSGYTSTVSSCTKGLRSGVYMGGVSICTMSLGTFYEGYYQGHLYEKTTGLLPK